MGPNRRDHDVSDRRGSDRDCQRDRVGTRRSRRFSQSRTRAAPFLLRKRAFGVVPNDRGFLAEHYVYVFENQSSDFLNFTK